MHVHDANLKLEPCIHSEERPSTMQRSAAIILGGKPGESLQHFALRHLRMRCWKKMKNMHEKLRGVSLDNTITSCRNVQHKVELNPTICCTIRRNMCRSKPVFDVSNGSSAAGLRAESFNSNSRHFYQLKFVWISHNRCLKMVKYSAKTNRSEAAKCFIMSSGNKQFIKRSFTETMKFHPHT